MTFPKNKMGRKRTLRFMGGVDGGGSKTTVAIANEFGEILAFSQVEGSRLESVGIDRAKKIFSRALQQTLQEADLTLEQLSAVGFGIGGLDTEELEASCQKAISSICPPGCIPLLENDAIVGMYSGAFSAPGIGIVAGTGSLAAGINDKGREERVGGWGYLFGDEGSAFSIGRKAVIASLRAYDGRGPETMLKASIEHKLDLRDISQIMWHFANVRDVVSEVAHLAPLVDDAASNGDEQAITILAEAGRQLGEAACVLIRKLAMEDCKEIPIVLIGGVFNSSRVRESFKKYVTAIYPNIHIIIPDWHPVLGALLLAFRAAKVELSNENLKALQRGLRIRR